MRTKNMKAFNNIFILLVAVFAMSCGSKKTLDREDYIKWANAPGNELFNEKKVGDYTFIAQYKPLDFVVLSEFDNRKEIAPGTFDSLKKEFDGMQYFVLKIGTSDPSNDMLSFRIAGQQEYYNRIEYFSTQAQHDIFLVDDNDTIACGLYHFERTYGVSPYNNLILGFEKRSDQCARAKQLHFNDQALGNGMLIFSFPENVINTIPLLKL